MRNILKQHMWITNFYEESTRRTLADAYLQQEASSWGIFATRRL